MTSLLLLLLAGCGCYSSLDEALPAWSDAYCTRAQSCPDHVQSYEDCVAQFSMLSVPEDCDFQGCMLVDCIAAYEADPQCANGYTEWVPLACGPLCSEWE